MTNSTTLSSREDAAQWLADMLGNPLLANPLNGSYQNQLGASQKSPQHMPDPALMPGTIITDRCFIMDTNNRLWLMDPHDGTIKWLQSPHD